MGSPIRSAHRNKNQKTQPVSIRERGGIYDRVGRVCYHLLRRIRCEFRSPAIVIFNTSTRGPIRLAGKTSRGVERDPK